MAILSSLNPLTISESPSLATSTSASINTVISLEHSCKAARIAFLLPALLSKVIILHPNSLLALESQ